MKKVIAFFILSLFSIALNAQSVSRVIQFSQSLRRGDGLTTLVIGSEKMAISTVEKQSDGYSIYVKSHQVKREMVKCIYNYILKNCDSNYTFANGDGYQVIIRLIKGKQTITCGLVNAKLVKNYFEKLITYLKKLSPNKERDLMVSEMQQIIDYATLPKYRGEK